MVSEKIQNVKRRFIRLLLDKSLYITAAVEVARSLTLFAISRSPLSLIEGAVGSINVITQFVGRQSDDFFNSRQGWEGLVCSSTQQPIFDILTPVLENFPSSTLNFHYNNNQSLAKLYTLPNGKMIGKDEYGIWHYKSESAKQEMLDFLFSETFKSIHSQVFSIVEKAHRGKYSWDSGTRFILKNEELAVIKSPTSNRYLKHIKRALDKGINRSIIFLGGPGVGKSTLTNTIIKELGLRTLKFKYDPQTTDLLAIENIVDALKVEALILDDFDTVEGSIALLGFLERMHQKLKLTIAIVNTLAQIPPAILRPARFDEIIAINTLDPSVIKEVLGTRFKALYPKVKNWPIAYIKELNERIKIDPKINIAVQIRELDRRVKNQIRALKEVSISE